MMLNRLRRPSVEPDVEPTAAPDAPREKIPTWFIVETMAAVMTIGSLLLDLRHKSRVIRKSRHQVTTVADRK